MPIGLVIFDCDGVLGDGEVISCRARAEVFPPCYCGVDHAKTLRNTSAVATFDDLDTQKTGIVAGFSPV